MDQYCRDFVCTYKAVEAEQEEEDEDEEVGDMLYQAQLLQAFGLDSYTDDLDTRMNQLYIDLKARFPDKMQRVIQALDTAPSLSFLRDVFIGVCNPSPKNRELLMFRFVFQFAYFDAFHKCMASEWKDETAVAVLLARLAS